MWFTYRRGLTGSSLVASLSSPKSCLFPSWFCLLPSKPAEVITRHKFKEQMRMTCCLFWKAQEGVICFFFSWQNTHLIIKRNYLILKKLKTLNTQMKMTRTGERKGKGRERKGRERKGRRGEGREGEGKGKWKRKGRERGKGSAGEGTAGSRINMEEKSAVTSSETI